MPFDGVATPLGHLGKFDEVIDLIGTPDRWIKHAYRSSGGGFCLKEALSAAGIAEAMEPIVIRAAEARMDRQFCCLESFNDWPLTTHKDVVGVLHDVRARIISGNLDFPAPAANTTTVRGNKPKDAPAAGFWQKLFCWN